MTFSITIPAAPIHTGYWVDHSRGTVLGGTLTYSTQWGSMLVSTAALLVTLTGASVWAISAFFIHQRQVSSARMDEFDAQKQVILRNAGSPNTTLLSLLNLGFTWHGRAEKARRRAFVHALAPLAIFVGFLVAGIFVAQISQDPFKSQVLARPGTCGFIQPSGDSLQEGIRFAQLLNNVSVVADSYARDCYSRSTTDAVACNAYAKPQLPYTSIANAPCPIGLGNCAGDNAAASFKALELDTHYDLGINAKPENRLKFSYNATCAPINQTFLNSYVTLDNSSGLRDDFGSYPVMDLNMGSVPGIGFTTLYNYSTVLAAYGGANARYSVNARHSVYPHDGYGGTFLVRPFNQSTDDITIFIIAANSITYIAPSQDPIFQTGNVNYEGGYPAANYFTAIACTENYQICDYGGNCTSWVPWTDLGGSSLTSSLNAAQNATYNQVYQLLYNANLYGQGSVPSPLRATDSLTGTTTSIGLPDNQWAIEAESWYQGALAKLQYLSKIYTNVPENIAQAYNLTIYEPQTPEERALCYSQRIMTPAGYASYNVFALVFIFVIAVLVISASLILGEFGDRLPHRKQGQKNHIKLLAYQSDGLLQLHRRAVEGAGFDGWEEGKGAKKEVPYVKKASKRLPAVTTRTRSGQSDEADEFLKGSDEDSAGKGSSVRRV